MAFRKFMVARDDTAGTIFDQIRPVSWQYRMTSLFFDIWLIDCCVCITGVQSQDSVFAAVRSQS